MASHRLARGSALWIRVQWSYRSLDDRLVAGSDPASDPALAMRAARLRSARYRRRLAASIERLMQEPRADRWSGMSAAVPVVRDQVTAARDSLSLLARMLRDAEDVRPRGVATVVRLLTDANSVVYTDSARGALELQVQAALRFLAVDGDETRRARHDDARRPHHVQGQHKGDQDDSDPVQGELAGLAVAVGEPGAAEGRTQETTRPTLGAGRVNPRT